jgi:hypothetical protein
MTTIMGTRTSWYPILCILQFFVITIDTSIIPQSRA